MKLKLKIINVSYVENYVENEFKMKTLIDTNQLIKDINKLIPYYLASQEPLESAENMRRNIIELIQHQTQH